MNLRTTKANTKADGLVEYLQLCHNYYDKATKRSKTEVVYNFGRKDDLDIKTIEQLITNLAGFIAKESGEAPPQLFADAPCILSYFIHTGTGTPKASYASACFFVISPQ